MQRSARLLKVSLEEEGAAEISRRARGTPRVANRLLRRVRDYAQVKGDGTVSKAVAEAALKMLDVDALGLDLMDRKLLLAVIEKFGGGPVGLENLAHAIGEEADTIEDVLEPYLIQQGYLQRTPRGRIATLTAYRHFGIVAPAAVKDLLSDTLKSPSPVRVYYQDTDAGGVVFHAPVPRLHGARAQRAAERSGHRPRALRRRARHRSSWSIDIDVKYHQPARLNDLLSVSAEVVKMGRASFVFHQRVERGAELLVEADVTLALVDRDRMKPARMPAELATGASK